MSNFISGLASGLDWDSIISQLREVEHQRVDLVENKKSEYEDKLKEWRSFNTQLLNFQTAAQALSDPEDFSIFSSYMNSNSSTDAEDLLFVSTTSDASQGSYSIKISSIATAQKLSSASFSDKCS